MTVDQPASPDARPDRATRAEWGVTVAISADPYHRGAVAYGRERSAVIAEAFIDATRRRMGATAEIIRRSDLEWLVWLDADDPIVPALLSRPWSHGAQAVDVDGATYHLELAIGIVRAADFADDVPDDDAVISAADAALSKALVEGLSAVIASPGQRLVVRRDIEVANALMTAADDDFSMYYQPIVALDGSATLGWESLLRWSWRGSIVEPAVFMPVAEATTLIVRMGRPAIASVFRDLAGRISSAHGDDVFVSINLSAKQLWDETLPGYFAALAARHRVALERVWIEVSEIDVIEPSGVAARTLFALHELGCVIGVDDLGAGFSALRYVRDLPIGVLKIDRSLVAPLPRSASGRAVVRAICEMAAATGITTVAEGIETGDELDAVAALRFDLGQGYLLGRPLPPDELFT
ncbi:EAL domain-containing protein [Gordonia sp. DT219]|uniref:EAL domain-containing protein n=1 Tax=Gordonia sp. DT219 TaxID=3416658 RepID=UPI003CE7B4AF